MRAPTPPEDGAVAVAGLRSLPSPSGCAPSPRLLTAAVEGGPEPTPLWPKGRDLVQTACGFSSRPPAEAEEGISPWGSLFLTSQTGSEGKNHLLVHGSCRDTWWLREEASSVQLHYLYTISRVARGGVVKRTSIQDA